MADYLKLFKSGADIVGLGDDIELLEKLVEVVSSAAALARHIDGPTTAEAFLTKFTADLGSAEVKRAFDLAGLADLHSRLVTLVGKADDLVGKIPEKYKALLTPLSAFNAADSKPDSGIVHWIPLNATQDVDVGEDFTLQFGGTAKIEFEAGDRATIAGVEMTRPLLRLDLEAAVNAKAGMAIPIKFGSIGGEASAALGVGLQSYFDTGAATGPYAFAVATRLPHLPNPFDFGAVWDAFQDEKLGLEALVYTFTEKAKVNVKLALADSGAFQTVMVDVTAAIAAEASLTRTFQLTVGATPLKAGEEAGNAKRRNVAIRLIRGAEDKFGVTAGLSVGVAFPVQAKRIQKLLKTAIGEWDAVLGEISPFLSPGTLLQTELGNLVDEAARDLIDDQALRETIVRDLRTTIGVDGDDRPALETWLSKRLEESINDGAGKLLGEVDGVRDLALAALAKHLPSVARPDAEAALRAQLAGAIDPLVAKAQDALLTKVRALIARPGNVLGKALKKANVWSGANIQQLDEVLAPLRQLIEKVNKLLHDALEIAEDASRQKISASLQFADQWLWGEEDQIVGTFVAKSDAASALFTNLTRGNLDELVKLVDKRSTPPPAFELDTGNSYVKKTAERTSSGTFALVLFGFGSSGEWLVNGKAKILVDGDGNVQLDDEGKAKKRFLATNSEQREVSFVDTHSLRLVHESGGLSPDIRSIGVTISVMDQDQKLEIGELRGFIKNLEKVELLRPGTGDRATSLFAGWAGSNNPDASFSANIAARVRLDKTQVETMMRLGGRKPGSRELTQATALEIMAKAASVLERAGVEKPVRIEGGVDRVKRVMFEDLAHLSADVFIHALARSDVKLWEEYSTFDRTPPEEVMALDAHLRRMRGLLTLVEGMGQIYEAAPKTAGNPGGWDERKYRDRQHAVASGAAVWLHSNGFLLWLDSKVHPITAAFLRTMTELAGLPPGTGLSLDITPKNKAGRAQPTVTLS